MTLGAADRVVIIDNGFAPYLSQLGVGQDRINQIPNWIDIDAIRPMDPDVESRRFLGAGADDFLVLHAGNLGRKQAVDYVAHLFARLGSRFKLVVIGAGTGADALHELNLDNVRVLSLQPAEDLPRLLAAADAMLLSQRRDVVDSVVPSKLLMYLASGRPVIAAVNELSPAARIVRESDGGILVQPENPTALDLAVNFLACDPTARATHGLHGRAYAVRNYERGAVLERWDRLLAEMTAGHVAGRTRAVT
jgi:colanic acid biosynthesis glycosyl transferase WcaI